MTRQIEIMASPPLQITKPLTLVGNRAYAATWPYVKVTEDGKVRHERALIIIRDDGEQFHIEGDASQNKLGLSVHLPEIPTDNKLWSQQGVKDYRIGQKPDPSDVFQRIVDIIERFIDFDRSLADQRTMAELIACFIMSTWFLVVFSVVGYLWPNGEKG